MSAAESSIPRVADDAARLAADSAALRRVLTNAAALVVAYALPRILTLGAVALAARTLGTERFGAYGAAGAAAVIFSILSTAGMQPLLVREMVRDRGAAAQLLRNAHWLKTALNVLMIGLLLLTSHAVFGLSGEAFWAALLLGVGYAVGSYAENFAAYFQAIEKMHVWTAANAAYGIVAGTAGAVLIVVTASLPWFCAAMILGQLATVAWLYLAYRREHGMHMSVSSPHVDMRALLRAALPFAAAFLALTIYCKADVLMLARVRAGADTGLYTAAYKLVDIAQALLLAAIIATYPRLTRAAVARADARPWAAGRYAELAITLTAPAACLAFMWRQPLIVALYGVGYEAAAAPAGLLALALMPLSLNLLAGYVLAAADRMKMMALLYACGALLKIPAVALVAPRWGVLGVATVMLVSELLLAAAFQIVLHHAARAAAGWRAAAAVTAALATCAVVSLLPLSTALQGLTFLAVVLIVYSRIGVLDAAERAAVASAFRKQRHVGAATS